MLLIPNYTSMSSYPLVFDYLGKPYGIYQGVLFNKFSLPWVKVFPLDMYGDRCKTHRRMYATDT